MQNLPYRGGAPAILATVAGEAQLAVISPLAANAQIAAGTLRPIATGSAMRDVQFPDLPAVAETFRVSRHWRGSVSSPLPVPRAR